MTLNLKIPAQEELRPKITVFGVGGAGGNAVNNMIEKQLDGVDFVVANTDAQALAQSRAPAKVQMGIKATEGLGAGARPAVGAAAAEESIEQIVDHLVGSHMCFITAGMGGGTGTGAAPIIAQAARELGVLTVGVVTKPFHFEGAKRMRKAEEGVENLQKVVDTLIIIPNQNLFRLANEKTTFTEAFSMADDVLYQGVKGVTDLMVRPGLINLDFADVRALQAAEKAIANPLLDEISLRGAKGVLINITGGYDLTLFELDEAANRIREEVDPDANIIVGSTLDPEMTGIIRVSVVATGIDASTEAKEVPVPRRRLSEPLTGHVSAEMPKPMGHIPGQPAMPGRTAAMAQSAQSRIEEPTLFHDLDPQPVAAPHSLLDDDLPPPAYAPQQTPAFEPGRRDMAGDFRPQSPAPGTPSPETIRRLEAAVRKAPDSLDNRAAAARPEPAQDKARFGINSLINRMTGHGHGQTPAAEPRSHSGRSLPPMQSLPQDNPEDDAELEKIEIPAFLRRQAN
jgi:cell division protein FtsZ